MSADTSSSLFPDRPIRPLPKRRLRQRLSPAAADSIQYPQVPQITTPLFTYPYPLQNEDSESGKLPRESSTEAEARPPRRSDTGAEARGDESPLRQGVGNRGIVETSARLSRLSVRTEHGRSSNSQLPLSAVSSADGYDLLENTNNKKKRKIPTAGDAALGGIHALSDAGPGSGSLAAAVDPEEGNVEPSTPTSTPYYGSGSFASGGQNVPGPGRGRYGRPRSGRSPLRPLSDSTNSWAGRSGKLRAGQWTSGAKKLAPQQGQENMSLLQHQLSTKRGPSSTQFTFTCDSQVPGTIAWPGSDRRFGTQPQHPPPGRGAAEGWSRSSQAQGARQSPIQPQAGEAGSKDLPQKTAPSGQGQPAPAAKTSRRSAAKEYNAAAKARRRETQLYNKRHPPKPEEIWICHFCEYEAIFGRPPEALVRQYEIKDRKQRQLEQQRRAQWERMKKGKHKSKKTNKAPAKASTPAQDPNHVAGTHGAPMNSNYSQGTQSEEYYDDEEYEDEDYEPEDDHPRETPAEPPAQQETAPGPPDRGTTARDRVATNT